MKIKFKINHRMYFSYSDTYHEVTVTAWLPKEPNSNEVAYCCHGYLGDTTISYFSGKDAGEWRIVRDRFVSINSFEKAEEKALEAIERYKEMVARNIMLKTREKEIIADFDFPESGESAEIAPKEKVKTPPTPPPKDDLPF